MKDFTFNVPQDIIFGKGSLKRLPELLEKSGSKKMLLISGPVLKKIGMVEKVEEIVKASGIEVEVFTDVEANPSVATVDKATEAYKKAGATSIVAFGGGSPMDVQRQLVFLQNTAERSEIMKVHTRYRDRSFRSLRSRQLQVREVK